MSEDAGAPDSGGAPRIPEHTVVFQPIVDLATGAVRGREALARFADGRTPLEHLAAARARGMRTRLELALARTAVTAARALPAHEKVSVNASAATLASPELEELFDDSRTWGVELAETSDLPVAFSLADRCRALGVELLLDDVGAGRACREWVQSLRPDVVKIDRGVLWRASDGDEEAAAEFDGFVEAARRVGARTIVEGVERRAQARFAREHGADSGQGFLFGAPAPL